MRTILAAILIVFCINTQANDFELQFNENSVAEFNIDDWTKVSDEGTFDFYINKYPQYLKDDLFRIHSLVVFKDDPGVEFSNLGAPVKRIFSHGIIQCQRGIFYLMADYYTDQKFEIIFSSYYELGTRQIEVLTPNTARNKVYIKVCTADKEA